MTDKARVGQSPPSINDLINLNCSDFYPNGPTSPAPDTTPAVVTATTPATTVVGLGPGELTLTSPRPPYSTSTSPIPAVTLVSFSSPPSGVSPAATSTTTTTNTSNTNASSSTSSMSLRGSVSGTHIPALAVTTTSTSASASATVPDLGTPEHLTQPLAIHGAFLCGHDSVSPRDGKRSTPLTPAGTASGAPLDRAATGGMCALATPQSARLSMAPPVAATATASPTSSSSASSTASATPAALLALRGAGQRCIPGKGGLLLPLPRPADISGGSGGSSRDKGSGNGSDDTSNGNNSSSSSGGGEGPAKECEEPSVIVLKLRREEKQRLRDMVLQSEFARCAAGLGDRKALGSAFDAVDDGYLRAFALLFLAHLARITRTVFDLSTPGFFEQRVLAPFVRSILVAIDESPADFPVALSASTAPAAAPWTPATPAAAAATSAAAMAAAAAAARANGLSSVPLSPVVSSTGATAAAGSPLPLGGGGGGACGGGVPRRKLSNFSVNAEDTAPDTPFSGSGSGNYCSNSPGGREPMRVRSNSIASPSYRSASDSVGGASSNVSSVASSSMASPSVGASTSSTSSASTSSAAAAATAAGGGGAPKEKRAKRKGSGVLAPADDDAEAAGTPGQLRGSTYWSTPPTRRASPLQGAAPKSLEIPPLEQSVETTVEGLLVNKSTVAALLLPQLCTTLERSLPDPAMLPAGVASVLWKAIELAARAVARGGDLLGAGCDTRYLMTAGRFPYAKPTTPSAGTISTAASSSSSSASLSSSPPTSASSSASSSPANSTVTITTPSTTTTTTSSGKKSSRRGPLKSTNSTGSINIPITSVTTPKQQAQPQQVQQIQQMQSLPSLAAAKHLSPAMPQLQSAANVSNSNVIPNSTNSIINNSNSNVNQPSSLTSSLLSSSSSVPPPQQQQQQQQQPSSSSSSSATLSGGAKCSVCGGEDGLPPVSVRTLHWGNVFRDKSTGMYVYRSNLDKVQIGALADTVKMCVERGAEVPSAYILPARLFACGANWADFEFPVLFHVYVTRRVARGKLVKPTIIGSHAQIARVRQALAEAVATPTRAQLQADAGDDAAALAPEFEYLSEGRVMGLDEYINFREFDEATGVACVPLPLRNCPDRCGYLVIRKRASLLFFYEDGRLTGIVDSDAQHVPNPRAAEFYAQHAIPPPPSSQPTLQSQGTSSQSQGTSLQSQGTSFQSQGTSIPSAGSITNASDTPHIVVPSLGPPGATPGFVFTPPEFGVTFLGTSHGFDKNGRTSGCIVWLGGRGLAVDPPYGSYAYLAGCAGGAALRMIDGVLLTHCHADHDSGLLQFILGARRRLSLYGVAAVLASERRKLSATLGCADPTAYYRPVPVPVGVPTRIGAGVFVFNYSFHSIPTAAFKVACGGKTLFYSADTKYDPALYADLEARGVLSPERARHLASWGFDADHIIHEMGAPPLHTSVAVLNKLPPQVKARMRVIHCVSVPEFFKHEAIEGIYKPPEGLENTLRFDVSCPPDPLVVVSGLSSKASAVAATTAAAGAGTSAAGEAPLSVPRTPQTPLEAEALRLLGTTVPFLRSDPAALAALAPLARKKSYSKGKRVAKTHSGLYIVAAGAVIRRPADPRLSHSPSPNPIDGTAAAAAATTTSNSGGGDGSSNSSSSSRSSSSGGGSSKKKKSSHHHSQTQSKSQTQPQSHHKHPGQGSPTLVANGASGSSAVVLYYGDYFGENAAASASAAAAQPLYTYTAACTPTVIIRVSAKALRKILPQGRLLAPCIHGPTTAAAAPPHCLLRIFEAQCGECTAEALLTQGERSLERALSAASSPLPSNPKGLTNVNLNGSGNGNLNGYGISNSNSNVDGNLNGYGISNSNVNAILNLSGSGCPWAVCFVRKGSLLVKAAGGESGFRKVAAGGWFAPGKVGAIYVVEETSLCLVDWQSFERVVADAPYLLHYVKSSGVPM